MNISFKYCSAVQFSFMELFAHKIEFHSFKILLLSSYYSGDILEETSSINTHCVFIKMLATRLYFKLLFEILYQYVRLGSLDSNICYS